MCSMGSVNSPLLCFTKNSLFEDPIDVVLSDSLKKMYLAKHKTILRRRYKTKNCFIKFAFTIFLQTQDIFCFFDDIINNWWDMGHWMSQSIVPFRFTELFHSIIYFQFFLFTHTIKKLLFFILLTKYIFL